MTILLIDNYDSFTYNLYQLVMGLAFGVKEGVRVVRNNEITLSEIEKLNPSHLLISPGPGSTKYESVTRISTGVSPS